MPESTPQGYSLSKLYTGNGAQRYHELSLHDNSEIPSILELLSQIHDPTLAGMRVLELASGSGRVTLPIAAAGHRVLATDLSEDMLSILRQRISDRAARRAGLDERIEVRQADMTAFTTDERFKDVCIPTVSITLLAPSQQRHTLERATACLAPGGTFLVSTEHIVAREPMTHSIQLRRDVEFVETINPTAGTWRTILRWGDETYTTDLYLTPPSWLTAELNKLGLTVFFQHSVPHPGLPGRSNVLLGAVAPSHPLSAREMTP